MGRLQHGVIYCFSFSEGEGDEEHVRQRLRLRLREGLGFGLEDEEGEGEEMGGGIVKEGELLWRTGVGRKGPWKGEADGVDNVYSPPSLPEPNIQ